MEHRDDVDADSLSVSIYLYDDLACEVHRESIERRSYPLGAYLLDSHPATHWTDAGSTACYLTLFLINIYRSMRILTPAEIEAFPSREGEEVVLANEVNSDLEGKPRDSFQKRRKRFRGRQDSQPRKKRRIDEAAIVEDRLRCVTPVEMRSPDF